MRGISTYFARVLLLLIPFSPAAAQDLVINEIMAVNSTVLTDEDGEYVDWIEIWNKSNSPINLGGYHLTDDELSLDAWTFPSQTLGAGQYLIVFASNKDRRVANQNLHTNFKLTSSGEYLALVAPDGSTIISEYQPNFPAQFDDQSYGYALQTGAEPGLYLDNPSPGSGNSAGSPLYEAASPEFSIERGFYENAFSLQLSSSQGQQIRYTTNGTAPSPSEGTVYSGSLNISTTATIRAISYGPGVNPSSVETHSYIFLNDILGSSYMSGHVGVSQQDMKNALKDIPTISLTSPNISYADGNNNFDENPVSVEYWNPDGSELGFHIDAGFQTWGGSDLNPKKHYRLEFKSIYGESKLRYPIFETDPTPYPIEAAEEFDKLLLRGGSQDGLNGEFGAERYAQFIRNQFLFDLQMEMGAPMPHGRWVHVYLNGEYKGFYHLLERPDEKFFSEYFGNVEEEYEIRKSGSYWSGNGSFFGSMNSATSSMGSQSGFVNAQRYIDMKQTADYLTLNHYSGNFDWGEDHNTLGGADITPGEGGYKFMMWDVDLSLGNGGKWFLDEPTQDRSTYIGPIPNSLYSNSEFRMIWADRIECQCYNGGILTLDSLKARYNFRADQVRTALLAESARWGNVSFSGNGSVDVPVWRSNLHWETELNRMNNTWFPQRMANFIQQEKNRGVIPSTNAVTFNQYGGVVPNGFGVQLSSPSGGTIYYTTDGSDPRAFGGSLSGSANTYSGAIPIISSTTIKARAYANGVWGPMCPRDFYPSGYYTDLAFNEIHYNPINDGTVGMPDYVDGDEFEFLEIKNHGISNIDLSGLILTDGIYYAFPEGSSVAADGFHVLAANPSSFQDRYGFSPDGIYSGSLKNGGERIELKTPYNTILDSLTYSDTNPWVVEPDGNGASLSLDPTSDSDNSNPLKWFPSSVIHGSPKAENDINLPPTISISFPADGQRFDPGNAFLIQASVSDPNDSVDSTRFETGSYDIGTDETTPFSVAWTPPPGEYQLVAKAWDTYQAQAVSDTVFIRVETNNACAAAEFIVINEINYNDDDLNGPLTGDWVELYNPGDTEIDLSGWTFKDSKNHNWMVIPDGTTIQANGYHVLVQDDDLFSQVHAISNKTGSFGFGLDGSGDLVRLYSPTGCIVDEVLYSDQAPWPEAADGQGHTLELTDPNADNNTPDPWQDSGPVGGTPGIVNDGLSIEAYLLAPGNNVGYDEGGSVEVQVRVLSGASITGVELRQDGQVLGSMTQSASDPQIYVYTVSSLENGLYTFEAEASNVAGQSATTSSAVVCIGTLGTGAFVEAGGQITIEAENFKEQIDRGSDSWVVGNGNLGFSDTGYMVAVPDDGTKITAGYATTSPELTYEIEFSTAGIYYVSYRGWSDDGGNNSVHFGINGIEVPTLNDLGLGSLNYGAWYWGRNIQDNSRGRFDITEPGIHVLNLWMREDGTLVDKIFISSDPSNIPTGLGPDESLRSIGPNNPPVITDPGDQMHFVNQTVDLQLEANDVDGNPLTWAVNNLPTGLSFDEATQKIVGVPSQVETKNVSLSVNDSKGGISSVDFEWKVVAEQVSLKINMILSGAWDGLQMKNTLNTKGLIPQNQPYSQIPNDAVGQDFFTANPDVVDWVWIELRSGSDAASMIDRKAALLKQDGSVMSSDGSMEILFPGISAGNYYVVVGHRNHLSAMIKDPSAMSFDTVANIDFVSDLTLIYSNTNAGVKDLDGGTIFGLWPGDVLSNGSVKYSGSSNDRVEILNKAGGPTAFDFADGYFAEDVNMDGIAKYAGSNNDRVEVLDVAGGPTAFDIRTTQVPN